MTFFLADHPELTKFASKAMKSPLYPAFLQIVSPLVTSGEVIPRKTTPGIVRGKTGDPEIHPMGWGFDYPAVPGKTPAAFVYNASVEAAQTKESTKDLFMNRRCVIPASYALVRTVYRTDDGKRFGDRYIVQPEGMEIVYMAGIFRFEGKLPRFLLLTQEVDSNYERIPVFLAGVTVRDWIDPSKDPVKMCKYAINKCMFERE